MDKDFSDDLNNFYNKCASTKYLTKYGLNYHLNDSVSLKTFIILVLSIENDLKEFENLSLKFGFFKNVSFGREYMRYYLKISGFMTKIIFIQIPYNEFEFKKGNLFTIANVFDDCVPKFLQVYDEINDKSFFQNFNELVKMATNDFKNKI